VAAHFSTYFRNLQIINSWCNFLRPIEYHPSNSVNVNKSRLVSNVRIVNSQYISTYVLVAARFLTFSQYIRMYVLVAAHFLTYFRNLQIINLWCNFLRPIEYHPSNSVNVNKSRLISNVRIVNSQYISTHILVAAHFLIFSHQYIRMYVLVAAHFLTYFRNLQTINLWCNFLHPIEHHPSNSVNVNSSRFINLPFVNLSRSNTNPRIQ
jgi:hypothetical protein